MNDQVYSTILDTAKSVLKRSRLPGWAKDCLVDDIVAQALDAQTIKPVKGKRLARLVTRIARTIIHNQWYEVRWNADGKRLSKSILRIATPVRGDDGKFISPMDTVRVDMWGKLTDFVPAYRGGSICGLVSTPKNKNITEDRLIAWLDWRRTQERIAKRARCRAVESVVEYIRTRRHGKSKTVRERVRFHRLRKRLKERCNVRPVQTAVV